VTLEDIIREIGELSVPNGKQAPDLKGYVNRAQRQIASRRNWSFMKAVNTATIAANTNSVSLGSTFKSLAGETSPASFTYGDYRLPVYVASRQEIEARGIWPWVNGPYFTPSPGGAWPIRVVFLESTSAGWTLNIPPQFTPTIDVSFNVSAYYYPATLTLASDTNAITEDGDLGEALVNKTRAISYAAIDPSDPKIAGAERLYETAITRALYADASRQFSGRTLRM